jgi:hypothetical protein
MLNSTLPNPRVRLRSITNTQGLPHYRLPMYTPPQTGGYLPLFRLIGVLLKLFNELTALLIRRKEMP